MNCNCNNNGNGVAEMIKHVKGNVLKLAIPLTLRTIEKQGNELVHTDTDFIPSSDYPVVVELSKGKKILTFDAVMNGNVAYFEDKGNIPIGTYDIAVLCKDNNGNPYRFKQKAVLYVADATKDAGIEEPIEFGVQTWYLDAAIYICLKGEDGVGIEDIIITPSTEIGDVNIVTIVLTDGREKSFEVLNGSGSVDTAFDPNSGHPVANSVITEGFDNVFGDVDYDSRRRLIRFYNKGKTKVIATLDAVPFVKDGMVKNVYILGNTLVVTFNTDSGQEDITVPLTGIFNPNNYYTRQRTDTLLSEKANKTETVADVYYNSDSGKLFKNINGTVYVIMEIPSIEELTASLDGKVDKVTGKGLSTNDYTDADKAAVGTIGSKANSSDVYDKQTVDGMVANAGNVKSVSVNGGTPVQPVNGNVNLQDVATEEYVDDAVDDKLTQVVVNEISGAADIITIDDADMAFIDEDGNIAMRVAEGHIETQHFDSRQVGTNTTAIQQLQQQIAQAGSNVQVDVAVKEDSDAAFDISDPNGNVVLRIGSDGHIETKGFNSSDADGSDVFRATKMTPNCVVHGRLPINGIGPNSIALFKEAYRVGYRWFECDSKPCRDNGAILTHDVGPFTIYAKNDQSQTPITVNDFSGYDSTDLVANYTWTASTYTDGVITTEGRAMETLADAIWYVCYFLRCPLHVDKHGLTVAAQYQASSYAESLGVGQYVFHEIGMASDLANYANWDIPLNMIFFLSSNYMNDISNIAAQYKTQKNNIIFYFGKSTSTPSETLKTIADATHEVGCYAMTWDFLTSQIDELRRWFKAGFDFLLTTGITNADV